MDCPTLPNASYNNNERDHFIWFITTYYETYGDINITSVMTLYNTFNGPRRVYDFEEFVNSRTTTQNSSLMDFIKGVFLQN